MSSISLLLGGVGVIVLETLTIFKVLPRDYSPALVFGPTLPVWATVSIALGAGVLFISTGIGLARMQQRQDKS